MSNKKSITLDSSDNCFERAEKLFRTINLGDDGRLAALMARGIQNYMDLDKKALTTPPLEQSTNK